MLELIPIHATLEENTFFTHFANSHEILQMTVEYYQRIGYTPPWIGYFAMQDGVIVGSAGIKGKPVNNKIEIAYGTFPDYQLQGIGTGICRKLVEIAQNTDPNLIITARTLPENNASTRILQKNNFQLLGTIIDDEDGAVYEWQYMG